MANLDSLSFALLIPFAVCFLLVFLVCCCADQIKEICRMPSQLPAYYLTPRSTAHLVASRGSRRHRTRSSRDHNDARGRTDETHVLIYNEGGRSRNNSEMSEDSNVIQPLQQSSASTSRDQGRLTSAVLICPQIVISSGSFVHLPHSDIPENCVRAPHTITRSREGLFGKRDVKKCAPHESGVICVATSSDVRLSCNERPRGNINRNRSIPSMNQEGRLSYDNSSRSLRNLPAVIPLGLEQAYDKKS